MPSAAPTAHRCEECGAPSSKWVGRCGACGAWGSVVEEVAGHRPAGRAGAPAVSPVPLALVDPASSSLHPTGVAELDRVLGGGLVPGSVTVLGGEPGIGKSTLLLQVLASLAASGSLSLLVSAEESAPQVRLRAGRLGALSERLLILPETSLPVIVDAIGTCAPAVCVVDSIQTVADPELESVPGSVAQVRRCALALTMLAKRQGAAIVLVGHVTKDGALAGPRTLEHIVDTVLSFEGDRYHALRLLRAVKHRFGATGELGLFEMTDVGMTGVDDPSGMFLGDRTRDAAGSVVVSTVEGRRPLLVEVQALIGATGSPSPRRSAQGVDGGRLAQLVAVLDRCAGLHVGIRDVFVSAVGGARLTEPAADLGIALALASASTGRAVAADVVAIGEVGLGGELRLVPDTARRLAEAARLGFRRALAPPGGPSGPAGLEVLATPTLGEAMAHAGIGRAPEQAHLHPRAQGRGPRAVTPGRSRHRG